MGLNFKHIVLSAALALVAAPAAQAQFQPQVQSGATAQFLNTCNSDNVTYDRLYNHVSGQGWRKITEAGVVDQFFPEMENGGVDSAAVFEFSANTDQSTEFLYLGILKANVEQGLILVCQLRSFSQNVDGLRESFEASLNLSSERVDSPEGSEVYTYSDGSGTAFYDIWERKFGEGDYVFALGKTILYARNGN